MKTWRRPTLPRLKTQYHQRWKLSRPSSGWDRVGHFRHNHQVVKPGSHIFVLPVRKNSLASREYRVSVSPVWVLICARRRRVPVGTLGATALLIHTYGGVLKINRAISTGQLHTLLRFHTRPINVVVFHGSQARPGFEEGFPLRCFQRLSRPDLATLLCGWRHNRSTRGPSTPVLSY